MESIVKSKQIPILNPQSIITKVGEYSVVFPSIKMKQQKEQSDTILLNATAQEIIEKINGQRTIEELEQFILEHYEVLEEQARKDINQLLSELKKKGIIEWKE